MASDRSVRTARIIGVPVKVVFTDDLPDGEYGHCRPVTAEIRVASHLSPMQEYAVLLHEAMHFIWSKTRKADDVLTEEEVCTLAENLATVEWEDV